MSQTGRAIHLTYRGVLKAFITADRATKGAATDLFRLAKLSGNLADFEDKCKEAEDFFMSKEAAQDCVLHTGLPKAYIQAKSDIRGAFRVGLDFNRLSSYHKMKVAKAEHNKSQRQPSPPAEEPQVEDVVVMPDVAANDAVQPVNGDVIILGRDEDAPRERRPRQRGVRDPRGPKQVVTVEEALASGDVLDARTNLLAPEDMQHLMALLSKCSEHSRARFIKRWTHEVRNHLSQQGSRSRSRSAAAH